MKKLPFFLRVFRCSHSTEWAHSVLWILKPESQIKDRMSTQDKQNTHTHTQGWQALLRRERWKRHRPRREAKCWMDASAVSLLNQSEQLLPASSIWALWLVSCSRDADRRINKKEKKQSGREGCSLHLSLPVPHWFFCHVCLRSLFACSCCFLSQEWWLHFMR